MARMTRALMVGLLGFVSLRCAHQYTPSVDLPESPSTIAATVDIRQFVEARTLRTPGYEYGLVAPYTKTMQVGELATLVTEAIRQDFDKNRVFTGVTDQAGEADVVLTGTIEQFSENYQPKLWPLVIPFGGMIAWLIQADTYLVNAEVAMTLRLSRKDGGLVGEYRGYAALLEETRPTAEDPPGRRLNQVFSSVIRQIREQLIAVHWRRLS